MAETDTPSWLNSSFFETALRSGGYGPSVTVTACEIGRGTVAGDNYVCIIYRAKLQVTLEGRLSSLSLIVKSQPAKGEAMKVNIFLRIMLHISEICTILNRKTLFLLHIHHEAYVYMFNKNIDWCEILQFFMRNRIFYFMKCFRENR